MCGVWQWLRFLAGSVIIVTAITACFYDPVRQEIATFGANTFGAPQLVNAVADLVPNLLLAAFILVMEIWIWFMRLRVKLQLRTVGVIADRYSIEPRQG
jgi:predicted membrane-bound mannosyltransferase